jgi:hypothetical protein
LRSARPIYFLVHEADFFYQQLHPALAASWQQRNFGPCQPLIGLLRDAAAEFGRRYHTAVEESVLFRLDQGLPFDRGTWRLLVGEILFYGAREIPEIETAPETLTCLVAPEQLAAGDVPRPRFAPIQQAHFGARDLTFGLAYYCPEQAGWNDRSDVARLADYLDGIDPGLWTPAELAPLGMTEEDAAEELEFVRDWFPDLAGLYRRAKSAKTVIICETVQTPLER